MNLKNLFKRKPKPAQPVNIRVVTGLEPGQKCYECNIDTAEIIEAETRRIKVDGKWKLQLIDKPRCIYTNALNVENAEKHFLREIRTLYNSK